MCGFATPPTVSSQIPEEAFDHSEPGSGSGCKPHVEAPMLVRPALHTQMLVGGVFVADQIDPFFCGDGLVDHAQEARRRYWSPVALVIVRHGLATALLQTGLG